MWCAETPRWWTVFANAEGLARTLEAMRADGKLEPGDDALVALAESLAEAVDADRCSDCTAPGQNATLWREYRAAIAALMEAGARGGSDDDAAEFFLAVQTKVGNAKKP